MRIAVQMVSMELYQLQLEWCTQENHAIIGDLAFYHDMNGLLMAKINNINLNIVLLNNDGGGIFSYLPQKHLLKHILNVCLERRLD